MVLLVEDDQNDVFLVERALRQAGIAAPMHNATNGQEAIDYLQGKEQFGDREAYPLPYLILLDIRMPYMNGLEFLQWLKEHPAFGNIAVVMLTSSFAEREHQAAMELGALDILGKPPSSAKLQEVFGIVQPVSRAGSD
ncbi:MAG TPA: response regulator [Verrucomicrobiae bacterium]|nr:response regulator [Verrucomicrobiae bacterium]